MIPVCGYFFIRGQRSTKGVFRHFQQNSKFYHKSILDNIVDHYIIYKKYTDTFFIRATVFEIKRFLNRFTHDG